MYPCRCLRRAVQAPAAAAARTRPTAASRRRSAQPWIMIWVGRLANSEGAPWNGKRL